MARGYKGIGSIVCYLRADTGQASHRAGDGWPWGTAEFVFFSEKSETTKLKIHEIRTTMK